MQEKHFLNLELNRDGIEKNVPFSTDVLKTVRNKAKVATDH